MGLSNNYREGTQQPVNRNTPYETASQNPSGRPGADASHLKARGMVFKFATWNVRTMFKAGKLDNIMNEMKNMYLDVLGISETRWTESGKIKEEDFTIVYSGGENINMASDASS